MPASAVVYENAKVGAAYVIESRLKVMLETDYFATAQNIVIPRPKAEESQNFTLRKTLRSLALLGLGMTVLFF